MSRLTLLFVVILVLGCLQGGFIGLCTYPWVQRQILYAHKVHSGWWHDINKPQSFGFAERQVTPLNITTSDGETLYAWHILPLGLYSKHQVRLRERDSEELSPFEGSVPFELLQRSDSRLVISFHGNAGHVGQGWRTDALRHLSAVDAERTHVLTFDYRGFGYSTGTPDEAGLINDGVAAVTWALEVANIPPNRIVLLAQSLGTAVATAVAEKFVSLEKPVEFAGLVLVAPFSDLPTLLKTYALFGLFPVLSPFSMIPRVQMLVSEFVVDTWDTESRLVRLAVLSRRLKLFLISSTNDKDIRSSHSDVLFEAAITGASGLYDLKSANITEVGTETKIKTWSDTKLKYFERTTLNHGGHNRITTFAPVALAVRKCFD